MRTARSNKLKEMLQAGTSIEYRSTGNSLFPPVYAGDRCRFEAVFDHSNLQAGDIVFGKRQPLDSYFAHKILRIMWEEELVTAEPAQPAAPRLGQARRRFIISDQHGHESGWCYDEHIYGRLVNVVEPS